MTKLLLSIATSVCLGFCVNGGVSAAESDIEAARSLFADGKFGEAFARYKVLAERGIVEAQFQIGVMYENGLGVEKSLPEAAIWYERASHMHHSGAIKNLAAMYFDGRGVSKDQKKAAELYRAAALNGDPAAKTVLAFMYENGYGVPMDLNVAVKLLQEAANAGYAGAQASLGVMYWRGNGVKSNWVEAYAWWLLASEGEDTYATANLQKLGQQMTAAERTSAEDLASKRRAAVGPRSR